MRWRGSLRRHSAGVRVRADAVQAFRRQRAARLWAVPNAAGNHRKNLRLSLETSLRRLRTSYIDI